MPFKDFQSMSIMSLHSPKELAYCASQVFISFATDFEMAHLNETTPVQTRWVDLALSCFYVLEVSLKMLVHRGFYFWNNDLGWNWRLSLIRLCATECSEVL